MTKLLALGFCLLISPLSFAGDKKKCKKNHIQISCENIKDAKKEYFCAKVMVSDVKKEKICKSKKKKKKNKKKS